jgi:hypothetical protein
MWGTQLPCPLDGRGWQGQAFAVRRRGWTPASVLPVTTLSRDRVVAGAAAHTSTPDTLVLQRGLDQVNTIPDAVATLRQVYDPSLSLRQTRIWRKHIPAPMLQRILNFTLAQPANVT